MQFRWLLQSKICLFFNADKCRQHCGYVYVSVKVYSIPHFIITATILFFFQLQIFFLSRNRSVEKSLGSCRCCAAVYWKSGQDRSCSAGVGSLSPNENQMLMNQAIVAGSASEALALKPPLTHRRTLTPASSSPPLPPFSLSFHPQLIKPYDRSPNSLSFVPGSCSGQSTSEASPTAPCWWPPTGRTCPPR